MTSIQQSHGYVKLTLTEFDIESLPNHRVKSANEWSSACPNPICSVDEDGFLYWPNEGNFWCRQCKISGFIDSEAQSRLTPDQLADIEYRKRQAELEEINLKRTALQQLQSKRNDLVYHNNLGKNIGYVVRRWGLTEESINAFKVGYCHACPISSYSDSITIPYYWHESLINLRHRLSCPNGQGKYRPEIKGLPTAIFNANLIEKEEWLVLVEGEFKTMVVNQNCVPAIGIPGKTNFKDKWLKLFSKQQTIYVALDPGAESDAIRIAGMISKAGIGVRIVALPSEPDEFFTLHNGTIAQFYQYLDSGRVL